MRVLLLVVVVVLLVVDHGECYFPGVSSHSYIKGERLSAKVNSLSSVNTMEPITFYDAPFCRPQQIVDAVENLGEILSGDRIENSLYEFSILENVECRLVCLTALRSEDMRKLKKMIQREYRISLLLDGLPISVPRIFRDEKGALKQINRPGFPIGEIVENEFSLFNHLNFRILYNFEENSRGKYNIVGFEVQPLSIKHSKEALEEAFQHSYSELPFEECRQQTNKHDFPVKFSSKEKTEIMWTYSVVWEKSEIAWESRWKTFLLATDNQIHWLSISNSCLIVLFLTGMVGMILLKTIHADFRRYSDFEEGKENDESGWKLIQRDVFRPPDHPLLLAVAVGSGVQVLCMTFLTLLFSLFGLLSPAHRGALPLSLLGFFLLMGCMGGYTTGRIYRSFQGQNWKKMAFTTALAYPSFLLSLFSLLNLLLYLDNSAGCIPFLSFIKLVILWGGVSVPLVLYGSYYGYFRSAGGKEGGGMEGEVGRVNAIPRRIPEQVWYTQSFFSLAMGGLLPFGAVFIELYFVFNSLWMNQYYYIFGFLSIVFIILIITCAEMSIVMCYFQLCGENYHWQWRSFLVAFTSGWYLFLYSLIYFFVSLKVTRLVSMVVYFGYSVMMATGFGVMTGAVGFLSCWWFVEKIYTCIKLD